MDSKHLSKHWNTSVGKGHRHFSGVLTKHKEQLFTSRFETHLLDQVPMDEVETAWDWGCGGGMLSKMLVDKGVTPSLFDVSIESLEEAKKHVAVYNEAAHVTTHPDKLNWDSFTKPDLIACYHVIWHLPGIEYYKALTAHWLQAAPKYFGLSAKIGELSEHTTDNYTTETFYKALIIPKQTIINTFSDNYTLTYYADEKTDAKDATIGNFIFKRND